MFCLDSKGNFTSIVTLFLASCRVKPKKICCYYGKASYTMILTSQLEQQSFIGTIVDAVGGSR